MKKRIVFFSLFFVSLSLFSAEPLIKSYFQDGSSKQYNLSEIDSLSVIDKKNNYVLRIHYDDTLVAYYPTEIIGSIKFEKDGVNRDILNVYIFGYPKTYKLSSIDSLVFYIDQWQPLTIGSQVWMLKNLNVDHYRNGDSIPEIRDKMIWSDQDTGAWCNYNNDPDNGIKYGKLYTWFTIVDPRVLIPIGWHVPSNSEWDILIDYLGSRDVVGGKLKETGTIHWSSTTPKTTNESGFSALPGGFRDRDGFLPNEIQGFWWSLTEADTFSSWARYMLSHDNAIYITDSFKSDGLSIRCVKDK